MFLAAWEENFDKILAEFTASDPMREGVLWTNLSRPAISRRLAQMGTPASRHVVRKLLKKSHLGQRKACKKKSMGTHPHRTTGDEVDLAAHDLLRDDLRALAIPVPRTFARQQFQPLARNVLEQPRVAECKSRSGDWLSGRCVVTWQNFGLQQGPP